MNTEMIEIKGSNICLKKVNLNSVFLYFIVYAGYIEVLFPQMSKMITLVQIISVLFGVIFVLRSKIAIKIKAIVPLLYIALFFAMVSVLYIKTYNNIYAKQKVMSIVITFLSMGLVFLISNSIKKEKDLKNLFDIIISLNLIFLGIYFIFDITEIRAMIYQGVRESTVDTANPIWVARMCVDTIILIFFSKKNGIGKGLQIIFLFAIAFLMGSKGPIVAIIIVLYRQILVKRKPMNLKHLAVIYGATLLVVLGGILIINNGGEYISARFSLESIMKMAPGYRMDRYFFTLCHIPERILTGHGLGNWTIDYWNQVSYVPKWVTSRMQLTDYPHNFLLEILYECGIFPMIPLMIGFRKLKNLVINNESIKSIYAIVLANIIYAMFSGSITEGNKGMYYMFALLCGAINSCKEKMGAN